MTIDRRTVLAATGALAIAARAHAAEKTRITLWHAMSAALGEELNKLISAFRIRLPGLALTGAFSSAPA